MVANESQLAKQAQSHMADVVASIKGVLQQITDTVDQSKSGFQGTAAGAFQTAAVRWDDEANTLNQRLGEFQEKVGAGTDAFSSLDASNEQDIQKALTNLG